LFCGSSAWATPSLTELTAALDRQQVLLDDARDLRMATSRVENDMGQKLRQGIRDCAEHSGPLARIAHLGPGWRAALQSARVQQKRIQDLSVAPSVAPLIDERFTARTDLFSERLAEEVQLYQVSVRWMQTDIRPRIAWCKPELTAAAAPPGDESVAWVVAWMGTICAADGAGGTRAINVTEARVVRVSPPIACWSAGACDCVPDTITTGSALGPI
jgi:hypothetical protein